jgi:glycosyltransferase involved in cell wall biosynthesis
LIKNDEMLEAPKPFGTDPRVRYVKNRDRGQGNALNAGLTETKGSVAAITDDDCTVPPKWLVKFASIFATHPKVAVGVCSVEASEHDPDRRRRVFKFLKCGASS